MAPAMALFERILRGPRAAASKRRGAVPCCARANNDARRRGRFDRGGVLLEIARPHRQAVEARRPRSTPGRAIALRTNALEQARAQAPGERPLSISLTSRGRRRRSDAQRTRSQTGNESNAARGTGPRSELLQRRDQRRVRRSRGRSAGIDQHQQDGRQVPEWFLQSTFQFRRAPARHRRHLRRCDHGDVVGHRSVRRPHRCGLILWGVQRAARSHRRTSPCDWQSGARRSRRRIASSSARMPD